DGFSLVDATRGAVAIPHVYPPRECTLGTRRMKLIDGGITNSLPIDRLFAPPFRPIQVLAVDVSRGRRQRRANFSKVANLQIAHPEVPIAVLQPDTLGHGTLIYRRKALQSLIECGRRAAAATL